MLNPQVVRIGFNRLAGIYDLVATVFSFNYIYRSQRWLLKQNTAYAKVLIIGGGTGKFLMAMLKQHPGAEYCYIDISDKMIEAAKGKVEKNYPLAQVQFIRGSYTDIPEAKTFDLIVTNYFLDCFTEEELLAVMDKLNHHLEKGGYWWVADFNTPTTRVNRWFSKWILDVLYAVFNIICKLGVTQLPDFKNAFNRLKYAPIAEEYFFGGLLVGRIYKKV